MTIAHLDRRRSTPARLLGAPGPSDEQVNAIVRSALRVPDHGQLQPWRILMIRGDARLRLGEILVERALQLDPQAKPAVLDKDRHRFAHAPLVLAVIGQIRADRIPEQEQLLSGGCVCFALLQAADALGFGAQWLTGWAAYDTVVAQKLGLADGERILGFIHIGTPREQVEERPRPQLEQKLSEWLG